MRLKNNIDTSIFSLIPLANSAAIAAGAAWLDDGDWFIHAG